MSNREVEAKVCHLAAGIKDLADDNVDAKVSSFPAYSNLLYVAQVVIFAETRAHWVMTALA